MTGGPTLIRQRPGLYVTADGRFEIRRFGSKWSVDGTNDADNQRLIERKWSAHRTLAEAVLYLNGSVYEETDEPWPTYEA